MDVQVQSLDSLFACHFSTLLPQQLCQALGAGGHALEQVAQRGCRVCVPGDTPTPAGRSPEQPALADPAWAESRTK